MGRRCPMFNHFHLVITFFFLRDDQTKTLGGQNVDSRMAVTNQ